MKDGSVIIWSWSTNISPDIHGSNRPSLHNFSKCQIILVRASHVTGKATHTTKHGKTTSVFCDSVTWTCNDMTIVTSQSCRTTTCFDIVPDSHMIYVWDSHTGRCLMGITCSHKSLSRSLAPHPTLSSVLATAGSDGVVNVWDLDRGDCFFTHTNIIQGPNYPDDRCGQECGYLEIQFSPDGLNIVLTDECGRVTILDTMAPADSKKSPPTEDDNRHHCPPWMMEQYFMCDYDGVLYNSNGHCIDKKSKQKLHLSSKGVRCNTVSEVSLTKYKRIEIPVESIYSKLEGPIPLPEETLSQYQSDIQLQATNNVFRTVHEKDGTVQSPKIVASTETTAFINKNGRLIQHEEEHNTIHNKAIATGVTDCQKGPTTRVSSEQVLRDAYEESLAMDNQSDNDNNSDEDYQDGDIHGPPCHNESSSVLECDKDSSDSDISSDSLEESPSTDEGGRNEIKVSSSENHRKRKRAPTSNDRQTAQPTWYTKSVRHLGQTVGPDIISQLEELDKLKLFSVPVAEAFPAISVDYLKKTERPMDFRTIKQRLRKSDNIGGYQNMNQFQKDLILTFENCLNYYGESTENGTEALKLLGEMNSIYNRVI